MARNRPDIKRTGASGTSGETLDYRVSIGLAFGNRRNRDGRSILGRADELAKTAAANGGDCIEADEDDEPAEDGFFAVSLQNPIRKIGENG